jgi:hypothetical protein
LQLAQYSTTITTQTKRITQLKNTLHQVYNQIYLTLDQRIGVADPVLDGTLRWTRNQGQLLLRQGISDVRDVILIKGNKFYKNTKTSGNICKFWFRIL